MSAQVLTPKLASSLVPGDVFADRGEWFMVLHVECGERRGVGPVVELVAEGDGGTRCGVVTACTEVTTVRTVGGEL